MDLQQQYIVKIARNMQIAHKHWIHVVTTMVLFCMNLRMNKMPEIKTTFSNLFGSNLFNFIHKNGVHANLNKFCH